MRSESTFSSQLKDNNIIVIEFGRQYTKCGFASEMVPRAIIETGNIHKISSADELESRLGDFIDEIYFKHLAVSPKEKKVVIVESVFSKSLFRNTLTRVFFDRFNVPSLLFVPDHLMALATLGRSTGIVVDLGAEEAISIAVVDGVTLLDGTQFATLGAGALDSLIKDELVKLDSRAKPLLTSKVVEDIRVKSCFVAPFERGVKISQDKFKKSRETQLKALSSLGEQNKEKSILTMEECYFLADADDATPASVEYFLNGERTLKVPGNLREGACEIFFEIFGHEQSLTTMLIETILMAPLDCRRSLAENILVIGGLANLPGLEHRLARELKNIDKQERFKRKIPDVFKFHRPICPRNYVSWLGASMFCTPSSIEMRSTSLDQWLKDGKKNLRDWSDLIITTA